MQQRKQPRGAAPSLPSPCDPSGWRDVWTVEESSPSSSTLGGSPVESLAGCNEIESDEEECDYIAGLAEQIAHSMLDDDERSEEDSNSIAWTSDQIKVPAWNAQIGLPASPQSTLAGLDWCVPKLSASFSVASSNGSSKVASRISSPNSIVLEKQDNAWDLLYAAAGEVVKLTVSEERKVLATTLLPSRTAGGTGLCEVAPQQRRQFPASMKQFVVSSLSDSSPGGTSKEFPSFYRDKPNSTLPMNFQRGSRAKVRDEERSNSGQYFRAPKLVSSGSSGCRGGRHRVVPPSSGGRQRGGIGSVQRSFSGATDFLSSHHFPPLGQQQPFLGSNGCGSTGGSGMRAVFLGPAGSRESGGTGVFLPRRIGCGSESKKKPACSTVLLPSRIVEALNLNMEGVLAGPASPPLASAPRKGLSPPAALLRSNVEACGLSASPGYAVREEWAENRWTTARPACWPLQEVTPEINLPTEWTY